MSHHFSFPDSGFPNGDARLDLTDLYAFPKPGDAGKSILIMNVHPSIGENPKGPTTAQPFAPEALWLRPAFAQVCCDRSKMVHPAAHRLIGNHDSAFRQSSTSRKLRVNRT
jgi:hypothetical protein